MDSGDFYSTDGHVFKSLLHNKCGITNFDTNNVAISVALDGSITPSAILTALHS